jgi:hypothetical protein
MAVVMQRKRRKHQYHRMIVIEIVHFGAVRDQRGRFHIPQQGDRVVRDRIRQVANALELMQARLVGFLEAVQVE